MRDGVDAATFLLVVALAILLLAMAAAVVFALAH
jgi:hypothetical protein